MLDQKRRYEIKNYGEKTTFASFLPGIAGEKGIPIWCYYVNRGQAVTSFGIDCKDRAIMEFFPAHQAYQNVKVQGFRTFLKKNGVYSEPFQNDERDTIMAIGKNELEIRQVDFMQELETTVVYSILPNEKVGALMRKLMVTNRSKESCELEILDGMPAVIPYGVNMGSMKEMGQTTKAWMQVEDISTKIPYIRVRVSMEDTASVQDVTGGNFGFCITDQGKQLSPLVDPEVVFQYDTGLEKARGFMEQSINSLLQIKQVTQNNLPCCFFGEKRTLAPGETLTLYELYGQVEDKERLQACKEHFLQPEYYERKRNEGNAIIEAICDSIHTCTGNALFDEYCKQTYLDNVLRGGYPVSLTKDKVFYLYSRKHGDIERDYNYFRMLPEYYSQGNGNYRDVNQNRREDVRFQPKVGTSNIKTFYNLIQVDGYNPLSVDLVQYTVEPGRKEKLLRNLSNEEKEVLNEVLETAFTPGRLYMKLEEKLEKRKEKVQELFEHVLNEATQDTAGTFGEGYWSDHWTYNLDLVEEYLRIYPEKEKELLFEDDSYTYFDTKVVVLPRRKRYVKTEKGLRQYQFLDRTRKQEMHNEKLRSAYGNGEVVTGTLAEKLLLLITLKFATLDPYGMGIEMEGGKPGWYDALNGLPGIFGSSMAETYELSRMIHFVIEELTKYTQSVIVMEELALLMEQLEEITDQQNTQQKQQNVQEDQILTFWNAINDRKEEYREKTVFGVSGKKRALSNGYLLQLLQKWSLFIEEGIQKAVRYGNGLCPTYFSYEVRTYEEQENGILPTSFDVTKMPYFLEGPVRYMKILKKEEDKKSLYQKVKNSELYDQQLAMYKINAPLKEVSYEIGRCKAFTPGWLENESIWLHMEYKYLLELLRAGLYEEFFCDMKTACIPFLQYESYGRSVLENSSFLASSANPNEKIHGKGFVARLSGSTAEFLTMWQIMMFGEQPFVMEEGTLAFQLKPVIPAYLLPPSLEIEARLFEKTTVRYQFSEKKDQVPGGYEQTQITILWENGEQQQWKENRILGDAAIRVRNGEAREISIVC
ncbi:hypothetical protein [Anaerosporobacter faecicola]|uniref:hypothetical protein n=1 Tax=Anaerosporobacter faecicola TaxID=2718714 RepID=UPI001438D5A2|nr:hypothetical protein [Anaerosporobacter faecicola]